MSDPRLDELWQEVTASWGDEAAHAAFIEHCRATWQLGQAAARYREEVRRGAAYREDATRADTAQKRLDAVTSLAMLELELTRTPREAAPMFRMAVLIRWAVFVMCIAIVIFSMARFLL